LLLNVHVDDFARVHRLVRKQSLVQWKLIAAILRDELELVLLDEQKLVRLGYVH